MKRAVQHEADPVSALMRILTERWVLTLALSEPDRAPYPTPLFYALAAPDSVGRHRAPMLIFASEASSHHGQLCGAGPAPAAAGIYLESDRIGDLRGAQLRGVVVRDDRFSESGAAQLRACYLARHAVAAPMLADGRHHLYALILTWAKLTDARLGFGAHPEVDFDGSCSEVEQSRA